MTEFLTENARSAYPLARLSGTAADAAILDASACYSGDFDEIVVYSLSRSSAAVNVMREGGIVEIATGQVNRGRVFISTGGLTVMLVVDTSCIDDGATLTVDVPLDRRCVADNVKSLTDVVVFSADAGETGSYQPSPLPSYDPAAAGVVSESAFQDAVCEEVEQAAAEASNDVY